MTNKVTYSFNPFTSKLDAVRPKKVPSAESIVVVRNCAITAAVLDLTMESDNIVDGVDSVIDNADVRPIIGLIISKPTTTTCEVLLLGAMDGFSGLIKGKKVYVGTNGLVTQTLVTTGYIQTLGVASDVDTVNFNPQLTRVLRT